MSLYKSSAFTATKRWVLVSAPPHIRLRLDIPSATPPPPPVPLIMLHSDRHKVRLCVDVAMDGCMLGDTTYKNAHTRDISTRY